MDMHWKSFVRDTSIRLFPSDTAELFIRVTGDLKFSCCKNLSTLSSYLNWLISDLSCTATSGAVSTVDASSGTLNNQLFKLILEL